jgi:hydroxymethylpyrimidine pyrophosphatase-like HAD family hydrolase
MFLFVDVNETLIRTGRVALADRLVEQEELERFRISISALGARRGGVCLVLLTGNSFEYTRRVEEPLALRELLGVRVVLVSENGLLARDLVAGDLWRLAISAAYTEACELFLQRAKGEPRLTSRFFTQGNELRVTLKPVANEFTPSELALFADLARELDTEAQANLYLHPFYVDLDPRCTLDGQAPTKALAVARLADQEPGRPLVAIGDSPSDLPMFEAVQKRGGTCFVVANASLAPEAPATRVAESFTAGVNAVLCSLLNPQPSLPIW